MNSLLSARPFQVILLVVFGLGAALGLYLFASYTGGAGAAKVGTVVIWGTLPAQAVQNEIQALITNDKDYSKVTYVQQDASTFDADLSSAIASGQGPSLIIINQEQLVDEENKIEVIPFSSISQRTFTDSYLPEFNLFETTNGSYGVPYVLDPLVLYYNRNLLSNAGIAVPPASWEALTGAVPTLTKINPDQSIGQSAVAFGEYSNVDNARGILSLLFLQSGTTITTNTTQGLSSVLSQSSAQSSDGTPPAVAALNFYTQFSDPTRTVYSWNATFAGAKEVFIAGNLAFYIGYASEEPILQQSNPNLNFDMAQIPQPQTATTKTDYGLAYVFAIPKASANQKGALQVAEALGGSTILPAAAQALSMAPAARGLLTPSSSDSYAPVFYPDALVAQGWLSPDPSTTDSIFSAMITSVTSGSQQPLDALQTADQSLDAALPTTQ